MGASGPLVLTLHNEPAPEIERTLSGGLNDYNETFWPGADWTDHYLVGRDEAGVVQSGAKFNTALEWLFVNYLWVATPYRRAGEGSRLLHEAEARARASGCIGAYVDTFSFQAPKFYAKHGYREFGRITDFPPGHARIWVMKRF